MKVLCLFNKVIGSSIEEIKLDIEKGNSHDSWLFGMLRLPHFGIDTDFLEIEKYIPIWLARFLRKYILTMHYAHIPLFSLFFNYDIVYTSTAYGSLFLKALFRIKKFKWIILDFNILGTIKEIKTVKEKIFYWAIKNGADGIVAISQAEADALKVIFPNLQDKIIFIHEATDIEFFRPKSDMQDGRVKIIEKNQILSVGNYGRDFDTIIEAIKDIDIDFIIAGKFPTEKIKILPEYVKVVQFSHKDIVKAYAESKIVIVSLKTDKKYFDSVGTLSVGEALSMGKATIVTYTKNMESYIQDGINGVFVEEKNIKAMRNAIIELLKNNDKRKQLGSWAREFAIKNLDSELFAKKLAFFLKNVV